MWRYDSLCQVARAGLPARLRAFSGPLGRAPDCDLLARDVNTRTRVGLALRLSIESLGVQGTESGGYAERTAINLIGKAGQDRPQPPTRASIWQSQNRKRLDF